MTAFETCDVNLSFGQLEKTLERIGSHSKKIKKSWKIGPWKVEEVVLSERWPLSTDFHSFVATSTVGGDRGFDDMFWDLHPKKLGKMEPVSKIFCWGGWVSTHQLDVQYAKRV